MRHLIELNDRMFYRAYRVYMPQDAGAKPAARLKPNANGDGVYASVIFQAMPREH